jgi:hypothetical protein
MKRNYDKYTTADQAKINILDYLNSLPDNIYPNKSALGYKAFPEYDFRWPQGAAFAVAKICSDLEADQMIRHHFDPRGYRITQRGRNFLASVANGQVTVS